MPLKDHSAKRWKPWRDDSLVSWVFNNIRNTTLAAAVAIAGIAIVKGKVHGVFYSPRHPQVDDVVGWLLVIMATVLFFLNFGHGSVKILDSYNKKPPARTARVVMIVVMFAVTLAYAYGAYDFFAVAVEDEIRNIHATHPDAGSTSDHPGCQIKAHPADPGISGGRRGVEPGVAEAGSTR